MQYYSKDTAPDHIFEPQEPAGRIFPDHGHHQAPRCRQALESPPRETRCWDDIDQDTAKVIFSTIGRKAAYWVACKAKYRRLDLRCMNDFCEGSQGSLISMIRGNRYYLSRETLLHIGKAIRTALSESKTDPFFR